jgi:hypothetical protein
LARTSQLAERRDVSALPGGRGRGPGGQRTGLPVPTGLCAVPGCGDQIDPARLMCRRDWYQVPRRLRDQVWRTWRSGQEANGREHQEAVLQAIAAAGLAWLPSWRRQFVRLRMLLKARQGPDPVLKAAGEFMTRQR